MTAVDPSPEAPHRSTGIGPTAAVVAVIAFVVFGGYAAGAVLEHPAGPPVAVAGTVTVDPLSGWEVAQRFDAPPGVRLTRGVGNLDTVVLGPGVDPRAVLDRFIATTLEGSAERLSVSRSFRGVTLRSGAVGVRISYVGLFGKGGAIEGELTAVVSGSGRGVVFDAWAPQGLLRYVRRDVDTMISTAVIR